MTEQKHPAKGSLWVSVTTGRMLRVDDVFTRRGKWRVAYTREQSGRSNSSPLKDFTKNYVPV